MKKMNQESGMALTIVLLILLTAGIMVASMLKLAESDTRQVKSAQNLALAADLAEAGINRTSEMYWLGYNNSSVTANTAWLDNHVHNYETTSGQLTGTPGTYSTVVKNVYTNANVGDRIYVFESTGTVNGANNTITKAVLYGLGRSKVFDYAYFANNFGWLYGSSITINGDVRSNGNFNLQTPKINGDVLGSVNPEIGATGTVSGTNSNDSLATYIANSGLFARPTTTGGYQYGYAGTSTHYTGQELLKMPYLYDISYYQTLAAKMSGSVKIAGTTMVNQVYNGNTVLYGTATNPIVLNGPVVINGDLLIGGVVTGQGTIYTARNVHVIDNISYKNPPQWQKDGTTPDTIDAQNKTADFLCLASRGSVILGDYTSTDWKNKVTSYIKPSFTASYVDENGVTFNGDYTAADGGKKTDNSTRHYYESSYTDTNFHAQVRTANITRMDALCYTNHLFGGRASSAQFHGTIIMRDEAIIYDNSFRIDYDYRARQDGQDFVDIGLPKSPKMQPLLWMNGTYAQNKTSLETQLGVH